MQTPESAFCKQLEHITEQHPSLIVVGSVGRAAIVGENIDPLRVGGELRDIDVFDVTNSGLVPLYLTEGAKAPHTVDDVYSRWVYRKGDSHILMTRFDHDLRVPVDSTVFRPEEAIVNGVTIRVLNPRTQTYMDQVMGVQRPKDRVSHNTFTQAIQGRTDLLPESLFDPFKAFIPMVRAQRANEQRRLDQVPPPVLRRLVRPFRNKKNAA